MEEEVELVKVDVHVLDLKPGQVLVVKVPQEWQLPNRMQMIVQAVKSALVQAGLGNDVVTLLMPEEFGLEVIDGEQEASRGPEWG